MKKLIFFLILILTLCYTGLGTAFSHTRPLPNMKDCHMLNQGISSTDTVESSYKNIDITNQKTSMCPEALLNAPHDYDFSVFLSLSAVSIPISEVFKTHSSPLSLIEKGEYRPPDLFLINSSLLI